MPINGFRWDRESEGYYARHRLSNGQFCMVAFYRFQTGRSTEYHVAFAVADKKKTLNAWFDGTKGNNIELKMTGRCGVEALFWCRDKILEFEREVHREQNKDTKICVSGEDSKRFRLYERALTRYGYQKVRTTYGWFMVKFLGEKGGCV